MSDAVEEARAERDEARGRSRQRTQHRDRLVADAVINAFLVGVWATMGQGYFWPGWVPGGRGAGMVLVLWDNYRRLITDADIDRELPPAVVTEAQLPR